MIRQKEFFSEKYNAQLRYRQSHAHSTKMKGIKLTFRENIVAVTNNIWFQLGIMIVVIVDVIAMVVFEFQDAARKDCFGRDQLAEMLVGLTVIFVLALEVCLRIFGNGWKFFKGGMNNFDVFVVLLSTTIALVKVLSDFLLDVSVCDRFDVANTCRYPAILAQSSVACEQIKAQGLYDDSQANDGLGWIGSSPRLLRQVGGRSRGEER